MIYTNFLKGCDFLIFNFIFTYIQDQWEYIVA